MTTSEAPNPAPRDDVPDEVLTADVIQPSAATAAAAPDGVLKAEVIQPSTAGEGTAGEVLQAEIIEPPTDRKTIEANIGKARKRKGLVIVNTGDGKGKSSAAFGVMTRAWGQKLRVAVVQFIKMGKAQFGEQRAARRMGIDWVASGDGFTWTSPDLDKTIALARHGWQLAQQRISSENYDVVILDEFTYVLRYGWVDTAEVITWLKANKPPMMHLIITGRAAPDALIEYADLVTEMRLVKHPYQDQGVQAQRGIEY